MDISQAAIDAAKSKFLKEAWTGQDFKIDKAEKERFRLALFQKYEAEISARISKVDPHAAHADMWRACAFVSAAKAADDLAHENAKYLAWHEASKRAKG